MASLQRTNQPGSMVPNRQIRGAILPWEKQLIDTLGLTLEEYQWYANEVANYRPERDPAYDHVPHVVCDPVITPIVISVVGAGLSFAASALAPKPKLPKQTDPAQQQVQEARGADVTGASVNAQNRYTNVDGFTSVQPLARLGESMQMVFANRRNNYGGVRVETKLLWSQLLSQGDGQELLAIFLANGGALETIPDFDGMGIGDSLLRGYQASKLGLYFRNGNGTNRINESNKVAGELTPRNAADVFMADFEGNNNLKPIFSGVRIPSTMTLFGISEALRNGQHWKLPYKRVRVVYPPGPAFGFDAEINDANEAEYRKKLATVEEAERERYKVRSFYAPRTGLIAARNSANTLLAQPANQQWLDLDIAINDLIEFHVYGGNSPNDFGDVGNQDVIAQEDSIRQVVDDVIILGETYLVAGVEAVCVKESKPDLWDKTDKKIYTFKAIQAGKTRLTHEGIVINQAANDVAGPSAFLSQINPCYGPTVCKLAIAHFTTTRKLNQVEIGIKSRVFKRFNGIANFASQPSDNVLSRIEQGGNTFNIGTYSDYGLRYSFFRLEVKEKGATEWYALRLSSGSAFCVKGRTPVDQFNFIRLVFPDSNKQYEIRFRPIAGGAYLAYNQPAGNPVCVLDSRTGNYEQYSATTPIGAFAVSFKGRLEHLNEIDATNDVLFLRGKPAGGGTTALSPIVFDASAEISEQTYDQSLDGGNGGYITGSKIFTTSYSGSGSGLTVSILALQRAIARPVGNVVIGLQTRWLHMGIMKAPIPQSSGEELTDTVQFNRGSYYVQVKFTLRSMTFAEYATKVGDPANGGKYGTGYGTTSSDEGWESPFLWVNLNPFPSTVTILDYNGYSVDADGNPFFDPAANGTYSVSMPQGFATPANGKVQADISVAFTNTQQVYKANIQIRDGGSGYEKGDQVSINGLNNSPTLVIGTVTPLGYGADIVEKFDAVADVYLNEGQEGSHESGPEHQIVYINEQRENIKLDKQATTISTIEYAPLYENMSLLGLQLRSGKEWSSFNNFTYYAKKGSKVRKIINESDFTTRQEVIVLAGTFDASAGGGTGLIASVTREGAMLGGLTVGQPLPAAASANTGYYFTVSEEGTITSGNAPRITFNKFDTISSKGKAWLANYIYDASNLYPEILYHLISNSNLMPTTMVDWDGFAEACKVCLANNFYWDGVLAAPVNIRDWGTENAQYFFLDFLVLGGKLSLQPTFPVNKGTDINGYTLSGAYNRLPLISALFTDGNIIEDSLQVSWYPAEQRKAPQILVTLRDEVENGFAETRNILVKRIDAANPNPQVEAIDFTGFCTSADHAIQFAKLLINVRYHVTHTITFKTLPSGLALQPGQYFRVSSQARHVEQFQNGYVLENGTVVSSSPMADGTYTVYFWRSGMPQVEERPNAQGQNQGMVIVNGKTTPEFANSVFTQYNNTTSNRLYKAELISYDEEGMVEITGSHVPVETDGKITYLNMDATLFEVQNEQ
jgi:hypothetical protein